MKLFSITIIGLSLVLGCTKQQPEQEQAPPQLQQPSITQGAPSEGTTSIAGITWALPSKWKEGPARQMRVATYMMPAANGDTDGGECAVFYFGSGQGGDVEANISRWVSQFESPDAPVRSIKEVRGMKVTLVEVVGTYLSPGGPMMQSQGKKENYQLLGAIIDAPEGMVFFKATGPANTMKASKQDFEALVNSVTKM